MSNRKLLAALAGVAAVSAFVALPARADDEKPKQQVHQDHKTLNPDAAKHNKDKQKGEKGQEGEKAKEKADGAQLGKPVPAFSLTDTDGQTVNLADALKSGKKIVVLEWFNPTCPFILKHHEKNKTFNDLYTKYHDKGVEFFAINSSGKGKEGSGKDANIQAKKDFALPYQILLDESGDVGHLYGAKTTPHVFIIAKDGTLAYKGAIDNDPSQKVGDVNYAAKALDELLAGTSVTTPETRPYGCGVKYGAQEKPLPKAPAEAQPAKPSTGK
ncbi:MAG: redoxin family protein [Phycisphaerales bacterium]